MERIRVKNNAAGDIAGAAYGFIPFVLGLVLGGVIMGVAGLTN
ncbi:hypothetical protein AGMMS50268_27540 [Spirochaetia bacterium]|nr:hypothetical protein AGMMS50268_27540 [Spirochaetia bacterium]